MKISTRGRYALRLMLDLALADPEEYCSVKSIAARQQISEKYMEQIISQLVKAGFVRSVRGAQGGYRLAYAPEKYTAGQILRLTEGDLATVACLAQDAPECPRAEQCATRWLWEQMDDAVNDVLDRVTLAMLAGGQPAAGQPGDVCCDAPDKNRKFFVRLSAAGSFFFCGLIEPWNEAAPDAVKRKGRSLCRGRKPMRAVRFNGCICWLAALHWRQLSHCG